MSSSNLKKRKHKQETIRVTKILRSTFFILAKNDEEGLNVGVRIVMPLLWFYAIWKYGPVFLDQTIIKPTKLTLIILDIIYYNICTLIQYVSIPPGIIIRDLCKSMNYTNGTNNICTC
jgi:hypothetical protein